MPKYRINTVQIGQTTLDMGFSHFSVSERVNSKRVTGLRGTSVNTPTGRNMIHVDFRWILSKDKDFKDFADIVAQFRTTPFLPFKNDVLRMLVAEHTPTIEVIQEDRTKLKADLSDIIVALESAESERKKALLDLIDKSLFTMAAAFPAAFEPQGPNFKISDINLDKYEDPLSDITKVIRDLARLAIPVPANDKKDPRRVNNAKFTLLLVNILRDNGVDSPLFKYVEAYKEAKSAKRTLTVANKTQDSSESESGVNTKTAADKELFDDNVHLAVSLIEWSNIPDLKPGVVVTMQCIYFNHAPHINRIKYHTTDNPKKGEKLQNPYDLADSVLFSNMSQFNKTTFRDSRVMGKELNDSIRAENRCASFEFEDFKQGFLTSKIVSDVYKWKEVTDTKAFDKSLSATDRIELERKKDTIKFTQEYERVIDKGVPFGFGPNDCFLEQITCSLRFPFSIVPLLGNQHPTLQFYGRPEGTVQLRLIYSDMDKLPEEPTGRSVEHHSLNSNLDYGPAHYSSMRHLYERMRVFHNTAETKYKRYNPLVLSSPICNMGGMYNFNIETFNITNVPQQPGTVSLDVIMQEQTIPSIKKEALLNNITLKYDAPGVYTSGSKSKLEELFRFLVDPAIDKFYGDATMELFLARTEIAKMLTEDILTGQVWYQYHIVDNMPNMFKFPNKVKDINGKDTKESVDVRYGNEADITFVPGKHGRRESFTEYMRDPKRFFGEGTTYFPTKEGSRTQKVSVLKLMRESVDISTYSAMLEPMMPLLEAIDIIGAFTLVNKESLTLATTRTASDPIPYSLNRSRLKDPLDYFGTSANTITDTHTFALFINNITLGLTERSILIVDDTLSNRRDNNIAMTADNIFIFASDKEEAREPSFIFPTQLINDFSEIEINTRHLAKRRSIKDAYSKISNIILEEGYDKLFELMPTDSNVKFPIHAVMSQTVDSILIENSLGDKTDQEILEATDSVALGTFSYYLLKMSQIFAASVPAAAAGASADVIASADMKVIIDRFGEAVGFDKKLLDSAKNIKNLKNDAAFTKALKGISKALGQTLNSAIASPYVLGKIILTKGVNLMVWAAKLSFGITNLPTRLIAFTGTNTIGGIKLGGKVVRYLTPAKLANLKLAKTFSASIKSLPKFGTVIKISKGIKKVSGLLAGSGVGIPAAVIINLASVGVDIFIAFYVSAAHKERARTLGMIIPLYMQQFYSGFIYLMMYKRTVPNENTMKQLYEAINRRSLVTYEPSRKLDEAYRLVRKFTSVIKDQGNVKEISAYPDMNLPTYTQLIGNNSDNENVDKESVIRAIDNLQVEVDTLHTVSDSAGNDFYNIGTSLRKTLGFIALITAEVNKDTPVRSNLKAPLAGIVKSMNKVNTIFTVRTRPSFTFNSENYVDKVYVLNVLSTITSIISALENNINTPSVPELTKIIPKFRELQKENPFSSDPFFDTGGIPARSLSDFVDPWCYIVRQTIATQSRTGDASIEAAHEASAQGDVQYGEGKDEPIKFGVAVQPSDDPLNKNTNVAFVVRSVLGGTNTGTTSLEITTGATAETKDSVRVQEVSEEILKVKESYSETHGIPEADVATTKVIDSPQSPQDIHERSKKEASLDNLNRKENMDINYPNITDTIATAFPTYAMFFIRETENNKYDATLMADIYMFQNIIDLTVHSHKFNGHLATIRLANIWGTLDNNTYRKKIRDLKDGEHIGLGDIESRLEVSGMRLAPGTLIEIRQGYSANIEELHTVFTGKIAEVSGGDIVTIICQGHEHELMNRHRGSLSVGLFDGRNLYDYAAQMMTNTKHFGAPYAIDEIRDLTEHRRAHKASIYGPDGRIGFYEALLESNLNVSRTTENIWIGYTASTIMDYIFYDDFTLKDSTNLEGLHELSRYMFNHVAYPLPFDARSSMFVGAVDHLYKYTDRTSDALQEFIDHHAVIRNYGAEVPVSYSVKRVKATEDASPEDKLISTILDIKEDNLENLHVPGRSVFDIKKALLSEGIDDLADNLIPDQVMRSWSIFKGDPYLIPFATDHTDSPSSLNSILSLDVERYLEYIPIGVKRVVLFDILMEFFMRNTISGYLKNKEAMPFNLAKSIQFDRSRRIFKKGRDKELQPFVSKIQKTANINLLVYSIESSLPSTDLLPSFIKTVDPTKYSKDGALAKIKGMYILLMALALDKLFKKNDSIIEENRLIKMQASVQSTLRKQKTNRVLPPGYKPFRTVHTITDRQIISNQIECTTSRMANEVHVMTPHDSMNFSKRVSKLGLGFVGLDASASQSYWHTEIASFSMFQLPGEKLVRRIYEPNAFTQTQQWNISYRDLAEAMKPMYSGQLIMIGRRDIKPYDIIILDDYYNKIKGPIEVESVTHSHTLEHGFITTITPHLVNTHAERTKNNWIVGINALAGGIELAANAFLIKNLYSAGISRFGTFASNKSFAAARSGAAHFLLEDAWSAWVQTSLIKVGTEAIASGLVNDANVGSNWYYTPTEASLGRGITVEAYNTARDSSGSGKTPFPDHMKPVTFNPLSKDGQPWVAGMKGIRDSDTKSVWGIMGSFWSIYKDEAYLGMDDIARSAVHSFGRLQRQYSVIQKRLTSERTLDSL